MRLAPIEWVYVEQLGARIGCGCLRSGLWAMGTVCRAGADRSEGSPVVPSGSARSVVYLERYRRHAFRVCRLALSSRHTLAPTPHGASGLRGISNTSS